MLKFVKIKDPSLKLEFVSAFHPKETAFICSDIKSKQFLESNLLKKYPFLSSPSVLRANEFYQELFASLNKKRRLRSDAFVKQLLSQFLESQSDTKHLIQSQIFFKWFQFCCAFFLQDPSGSLFKEWFYSKKHQLFPKKWLPLFEKLFKLLESQNILHQSALKVFLSNELSSFNFPAFEKETLVVDLAFSMDLCEKDLFKELSRSKKVYILAPVLSLSWLFENKGYDFYAEWEKELEKKNIITLKPDPAISKKSSVIFEDSKGDLSHSLGDSRFRGNDGRDSSDGDDRENEGVESSQAVSFFEFENRTQSQEIKQAARQVSQWLQRGISPEEIVIYAPNIEEIWFILKYHLEKQSIPYKKTSYTSLIELSAVKYILSALRLHLNLFEFQDLETFYFYKGSKKDFAKFKQKHFKLLKKTDIQKFLLKERDPKQLASGFEFVNWAHSFWPSDFSKKTESAFLKVLEKLRMKDQLSFQAWLYLLESEALSEDIELETENSFGISCLSFNAFHSVKSPYALLLGLNESAFKESGLVGEDSLSSLVNDLGFGLDFKLPQEKEKSLLWLLQSSHHKEIYLSHYLYDLEGNIEGKALIYMFLQQLYLKKSDSLKKPLTSLSQEKSIKALLKGKSETQIQAIEKAFDERHPKFFHPELKSLSVSQLKAYTDCPFKYAAEKLFLIKDEKALEHELSPLIKGKTSHELFNKILTKHPDLNLTEAQKEDLIDSILPEEASFISKKEQVTLLKEYLKPLIDLFLLKEQKQRKAYPSLQPLAFEAGLKAFWDQKKGELSSKGDYIFKGSIDRVDQLNPAPSDDKANPTYIVRDYKASLDQLTHISSWVKKDEIQLLFYAQALQKGLVEDLSPAEVSALFYSAYNEEFKAKGFLEKDSPLTELIDGRQSSYTKTKKELKEIMKTVNKKTQELVSQIEKGEFSPQPKNKRLCQSCSYKKLCRVEAYV